MEPFYERGARRQQEPRRQQARQENSSSNAARRSDGPRAEPPTTETIGNNFAPARSVTVAAGQEEELIFRGDEGEPFAFDHLTVGGDYSGLLVSADTQDGERGIFNKVHLSSLRKLFLRRRLRGLIKIGENRKLRLAIENPTAQEKTVNVQLTGFSGPSDVAEQDSCLAAEAGVSEAPWPKLMVARDTVPSGASAYEIDVPGRPYPYQFKRFFVGSDADLGDLLVSLKRYSDVVYEEVYASQLGDAFASLELTWPFLVETRVPLKLAVTNQSGADADVTTLFEAYRQRGS